MSIFSRLAPFGGSTELKTHVTLISAHPVCIYANNHTQRLLSNIYNGKHSIHLYKWVSVRASKQACISSKLLPVPEKICKSLRIYYIFIFIG